MPPDVVLCPTGAPALTGLSAHTLCMRGTYYIALTRGTTDVFIYKHNQEIREFTVCIDSMHTVNSFNISSMDEKRKLSIRRYTVAT